MSDTPTTATTDDAAADRLADVGLLVVRELSPAPDVQEAFLRLCALPHCIFLDSAQRDERLGRYSYLTADPFDFLQMPARAKDPLGELAEKLAPLSCPTVDGLPPFQGGAAGLLGYELAHSLESLPEAAHDEFRTPALAVGLYDVVVAWDHVQQRAWIISQGLPELEPSRRVRRARERASQFQSWLSRPIGAQSSRSFGQTHEDVLPGDLAPQFDVPDSGGLTSTFSHQGYLAAVRRAIEYIHAGDVFQVNLAQRLLRPATDDSIALYLRLRERNPAPMAGYFDLGSFQILSASPERFLKADDSDVLTQPIKGTRPRSDGPEADLFFGDALQESEKDRAENVMIVDLLRNDLSRVCLPESVRATQLCRLETFRYVQHLVSTVVGRLRLGCSAIDLLAAAFPGGSITGAPKIRACQIIAELEPVARGPYCGCLGYLGFDGSLDTSILIRTITAGRGWWQAPVGGGIVAGSDPQREYEETWHKARGLIQAIG